MKQESMDRIIAEANTTIDDLITIVDLKANQTRTLTPDQINHPICGITPNNYMGIFPWHRMKFYANTLREQITAAYPGDATKPEPFDNADIQIYLDEQDVVHYSTTIHIVDQCYASISASSSFSVFTYALLLRLITNIVTALKRMAMFAAPGALSNVIAEWSWHESMLVDYMDRTHPIVDLSAAGKGDGRPSQVPISMMEEGVSHGKES